MVSIITNLSLKNPQKDISWYINSDIDENSLKLIGATGNIVRFNSLYIKVKLCVWVWMCVGVDVCVCVNVCVCVCRCV